MKNIAERIISKLGGDQVVGDLTNRDRSTVCKWRSNDNMPSDVQRILYKHAKKVGIDLPAEAFFDATKMPHN